MSFFRKIFGEKAQGYLIGDQIIDIKSEHTGKPYQAYVKKPLNYDKKRNQSYPVLYVLDGHYDFTLVENLYHNLVWDGLIDRLLIVGLTYKGDLDRIKKWRLEDLLPASGSNSSSSEHFAKALYTEIVPKIESMYRVRKDQRVIAGASVGAHFVLSSAFEPDDPFNGHIALSPPVTMVNRSLFEKEASYASRNEDLDKRIWYCVGGLEGEDYIESAHSFFLTLSNRKYRSLNLQYKVIEDETHAGLKAEGYNRSIKWVFGGLRGS